MKDKEHTIDRLGDQVFVTAKDGVPNDPISRSESGGSMRFLTAQKSWSQLTRGSPTRAGLPRNAPPVFLQFYGEFIRLKFNDEMVCESLRSHRELSPFVVSARWRETESPGVNQRTYDAVRGVIVYQSRRLHEGQRGGRTHEPPTAHLQVL